MFGIDGCDECCAPTRTWEGDVDCLALGPTGERSTGTACDPKCPPCARCSVKDQMTLYDFASTLKCDCSQYSGLGIDPDVPCERDCYFLRWAAWSCPHKVCLD